jgi:hypothetical protein
VAARRDTRTIQRPLPRKRTGYNSFHSQWPAQLAGLEVLRGVQGRRLELGKAGSVIRDYLPMSGPAALAC